MIGLPAPMNVKDVRNFLRHAGFYRRFIQDFSKIARPLTSLLCKEVKFDFTPECVKSLEEIKKALITAPIVQAPDWNIPFEIMCEASYFAVGAVLGQRTDKSYMQFTTPVKHSTRHKEITQQQKKNCLL